MQLYVVIMRTCAGNLTDARYLHKAVRIPDTLDVVVFGGQGADGQALASTEQLNYTTYNWTVMVSCFYPQERPLRLADFASEAAFVTPFLL